MYWRAPMLDSLSVGAGDAVAAILAVVLDRTGFDFSNYRRATLVRRIQNRMLSVRVSTLSSYLKQLQADPAEAFCLAERMTIKVSRFYRNASTFDAIRFEILPALAAARAPAPLRFWSAGCGCGEEPYTLAMLLDAAGVPGEVEATDIDEHALRKGIAGLYPGEALAELPADFRERYFEAVPRKTRSLYRVATTLRARVHFAHHDLTGARRLPGRERCELVACRNVLIYFQPAAQDQALGALLDRVSDDGIVCLGEAEWPTAAFADRLKPLHARKRIFRAVSPSTQGGHS
jgi:chemotaxis methyl-accepting protein methylase